MDLRTSTAILLITFIFANFKISSTRLDNRNELSNVLTYFTDLRLHEETSKN